MNEFGILTAMLARIALPILLAAPIAWGAPRLLDEGDYADRVRAMWLGEAIANWTGLPSEAQRITAPFFTDADASTWAQLVLAQDPWRGDDNTDIEAAYLADLDLLGGGTGAVTRFTPEQIDQCWISHINRDIWVSDARARALIARGMTPPATSLGPANSSHLMIDAQLTTEFFGALCPGMPERALEMADLPIRTTASGYAAHAAQYYVLLNSLAFVAPADLPLDQRVLWLYREARKFIPDSSKSADIADAVLADFLANPDPNDWERTRDLVYDRYQLHAADHGFRYRAWYESSVNFADGLIALLYGRGEFERTVQIGTLVGWDSDDGAATMGGVLGILLGYDALVAQIHVNHPTAVLSDRFFVGITRDNMPDHLPNDPGADDTFTLMAQRMVPIARQEILNAGGLVDGARWLLPPRAPRGSELLQNPQHAIGLRSANNQVRRAGGTVTPASTTPYGPAWGTGFPYIALIADGVELDERGLEEDDSVAAPYSTYPTPVPAGSTVTLGVTYDRPVLVHTVRFVEGDHFSAPGGTYNGGWLLDPVFEVLVDGVWSSPAGTLLAAPDPAIPFQILDFQLAQGVQATGIRVRAGAGGTQTFVTCCELDALSPPVPPPRPSFDRNDDGRLDVEDLHAWEAAPADLDGDGVIDAVDRTIMAHSVRFREVSDLLFQRP